MYYTYNLFHFNQIYVSHIIKAKLTHTDGNLHVGIEHWGWNVQPLFTSNKMSYKNIVLRCDFSPTYEYLHR